MPRLDLSAIAPRIGSGYPVPFHLATGAREKRALGDAGGLTGFGVNLVHLPPGAWSSQRHWHSVEDELVWVLSGALMLVEEGGETPLGPGDCATFAAGAENGHHLVNRSGEVAIYLEIGGRSADDACRYPDVDLHLGGGVFTRKNGVPY